MIIDIVSVKSQSFFLLDFMHTILLHFFEPCNIVTSMKMVYQKDNMLQIGLLFFEISFHTLFHRHVRKPNWGRLHWFVLTSQYFQYMVLTHKNMAQWWIRVHYKSSRTVCYCPIISWFKVGKWHEVSIHIIS